MLCRQEWFWTIQEGLLVPDSKATIKVNNTLDENCSKAIPTSAVIFDDNRYFVVLFASQSNIKVREIKILRQTGRHYLCGRRSKMKEIKL